jgi:hypothetical protein
MTFRTLSLIFDSLPWQRTDVISKSRAACARDVRAREHEFEADHPSYRPHVHDNNNIYQVKLNYYYSFLSIL